MAADRCRQPALIQRHLHRGEHPVYVDGDTGFGGVHNVREIMRAFEAAGVAELFFSDQVVVAPFPEALRKPEPAVTGAFNRTHLDQSQCDQLLWILTSMLWKGVRSMIKRIGLLVSAAMIGGLCLEVGEQMSIPGFYGIVSPAHAIVGRPATPMSVAGVARRTYRRCAAGVYRC